MDSQEPRADAPKGRLTFLLIHKPTDTCAARIERASNLFSQGIGLLGRRVLPTTEGLWLPGVTSIHTIGMRFPIDVLFLDGDLRAVRTERYVKPGRLYISAPRVRHIIELGAGTLDEFDRSGNDAWEIREA